MAELLTAEKFWAVCLGFEHTAFRLETRERYADDEEQESLRRFLAGEAPDDAWFMDWYEAVAQLASAGDGWSGFEWSASRIRTTPGSVSISPACPCR